jgi:hypothetical protein
MGASMDKRIPLEIAAMTRQEVHELLGFVRAAATNAQLFLETGDDTGAEYSLACLSAYWKNIAGIWRDYRPKPKPVMIEEVEAQPDVVASK